VATVVRGAGAVGIATAWYPSKAGHEVGVCERQPEAALETNWRPRQRGRALVAGEASPVGPVCDRSYSNSLNDAVAFAYFNGTF
jgi:glycine/D-amino acid oxidase-like deaminating enzyme